MSNLISRAVTLYYLKCSFQKKSMMHVNKWEIWSINREKKQLMDTITEELQIVALLDKDFQIAVINILKELNETMTEN